MVTLSYDGQSYAHVTVVEPVQIIRFNSREVRLKSELSKIELTCYLSVFWGQQDPDKALCHPKADGPGVHCPGPRGQEARGLGSGLYYCVSAPTEKRG